MEVEYVEKEINQIKLTDVSSLIVPREDDNTIADIPDGVRILQMQPDTSLDDMRAKLLDEDSVFSDFVGGVEIPTSALNEIVPGTEVSYQEKYFCMSISGADTAMLFAVKGGIVKSGRCLNCSGPIPGGEMQSLADTFGADKCYTKKYFDKRITEWVLENKVDDLI